MYSSDWVVPAKYLWLILSCGGRSDVVLIPVAEFDDTHAGLDHVEVTVSSRWVLGRYLFTVGATYHVTTKKASVFFDTTL